MNDKIQIEILEHPDILHIRLSGIWSEDNAEMHILEVREILK